MALAPVASQDVRVSIAIVPEGAPTPQEEIATLRERVAGVMEALAAEKECTSNLRKEFASLERLYKGVYEDHAKGVDARNLNATLSSELRIAQRELSEARQTIDTVSDAEKAEMEERHQAELLKMRAALTGETAAAKAALADAQANEAYLQARLDHAVRRTESAEAHLKASSEEHTALREEQARTIANLSSQNGALRGQLAKLLEETGNLRVEVSNANTASKRSEEAKNALLRIQERNAGILHERLQPKVDRIAALERSEAESRSRNSTLLLISCLALLAIGVLALLYAQGVIPKPYFLGVIYGLPFALVNFAIYHKASSAIN